MPEWITRKIGPLPTWGWAAIGVGVYLVYRMRKNAAASSASATPTSANVSASVPNIPTESVTTPSGFSYSGPPGGLSSLIPLGALSATNSGSSGTAFTPPTGESMVGGGYAATNPATPVTSASGSQFLQVPAGAGIAGQQYYYQPEPGIFTALPQNQYGGTAPGPGGASTPWFQMVSSSA